MFSEVIKKAKVKATLNKKGLVVDAMITCESDDLGISNFIAFSPESLKALYARDDFDEEFCTAGDTAEFEDALKDAANDHLDERNNAWDLEDGGHDRSRRTRRCVTIS